MTRPARIHFDLEAARANLRRVRALAPHQRVMAVIKADAYGHGLVRMAHAFDTADALGVACLEEAVVLREHGVTQRIVLLEGPFGTDEMGELQRLELETVVHHAGQLALIEQSTGARWLHVWIKIDTGMHRLGFDPAELREIWPRLGSARAVARPVHLMTHLACAHERGDGSVTDQHACFRRVIEGLDAPCSIANSAGILAWPGLHADWVRPGIMLYGVSPFNDTVAAQEGLRPVMTLSAELIAVRQVRSGESVGYGASWRCPEDMPIGVVALGYGDGYPRHAASGTPVLVRDRRTALIGKASMDMLTVDLRQVPEARVGDEVTLWGPGLPVEEVARWAGTIPYELLCGARGRTRILDSDQ